MTRILLAFSDTGGGHRAAATALREAIVALEPAAEVTMVDPYAQSGRWPFDRLAAAYPRVVNGASWLWRAGFAATNHPRIAASIQTLAWPRLRSTFRALVADSHPDVIVSTHPLLSRPLALVSGGVPLSVVVTDLASGHASWYERRAALLVVPTAEARAQALARGVDASRVVVHGIPVATPFALGSPDAAERVALEERLGWSRVRPTVLLLGGGDGVGPLALLAERLDAAQLPCDLAIVTGRNAGLADALRARSWRGTVHVYGFVSPLADLFRAAALVVSKAGPGTIAEACAAACPLVLWGAIPGQETGNVELVVTRGAGVWAPTPAQVVEAVRDWTSGAAAESARRRVSEGARALGRPHAAREIAGRVLQLAADAREARPLRSGPRDPAPRFGHSGASARSTSGSPPSLAPPAACPESTDRRPLSA
jgi:1,2-diacylglycerol 3-beta-galactosyltransferase